MTSIPSAEWPFLNQQYFRLESDGKVLVTILQEFFPQNEFPLLFRAFNLDYQKKSRRWGNFTEDLSLMQRQKSLMERIYEKYKDPAMQARIATRIDTINSILSGLTRRIRGRSQIEDVEIDAFQPQKFYIEIGFHGREGSRDIYTYPQIELLAVHDVLTGSDDGWTTNSIDFSGVSFNSNRGYSNRSMGVYRRKSSFMEFYDDNVEDNSTVLQDVYELTYETYVELIERLNPVGVRSLNYPRGDVK